MRDLRQIVTERRAWWTDELIDDAIDAQIDGYEYAPHAKERVWPIIAVVEDWVYNHPTENGETARYPCCWHCEPFHGHNHTAPCRELTCTGARSL